MRWRYVQSKRFLAVSLALSCGVMFYVSMIEIFVKSLAAFRYVQRSLPGSCVHHVSRYCVLSTHAASR